jgi:MYXO-CTERM domain-containing protein
MDSRTSPNKFTLISVDGEALGYKEVNNAPDSGDDDDDFPPFTGEETTDDEITPDEWDDGISDDMELLPDVPLEDKELFGCGCDSSAGMGAVIALAVGAGFAIRRRGKKKEE